MLKEEKQNEVKELVEKYIALPKMYRAIISSNVAVLAASEVIKEEHDKNPQNVLKNL